MHFLALLLPSLLYASEIQDEKPLPPQIIPGRLPMDYKQLPDLNKVIALLKSELKEGAYPADAVFATEAQKLLSNWNPVRAKLLWLTNIHDLERPDNLAHAEALLWKSVDAGELSLVEFYSDYAMNTSMVKLGGKYLRKYGLQHALHLNPELRLTIDTWRHGPLQSEADEAQVAHSVLPMLSRYSQNHFRFQVYIPINSALELKIRFLAWLPQYPDGIIDNLHLDPRGVYSDMLTTMVDLCQRYHVSGYQKWIQENAADWWSVMQSESVDGAALDTLFAPKIEAMKHSHRPSMDSILYHFAHVLSVLSLAAQKNPQWLISVINKVPIGFRLAFFFQHPGLLPLLQLPREMPEITQIIGPSQVFFTLDKTAYFQRILLAYSYDEIILAMKQYDASIAPPTFSVGPYEQISSINFPTYSAALYEQLSTILEALQAADA